MITMDEVKKAARIKGFPAGVIEKDYALGWLLYGIYKSELKDVLVFKGGTALSKAYFPGFWRLSEDLDFTAIKEHDLKESLKLCLEMLSKDVMEFELGSFHANPEHIIAEIRFRGPLGKNGIRVDISLKEKIITKPVRKEVNPEYIDGKKFKILVYSLDEIFAEKLRSIIQRGKSRDYFDIWMLLGKNKFDEGRVKKVFAEKCRLKGIVPAYDMFFEDTKLNETRDFWETGLARLMKDIPDFDIVINDLRKRLEFLR